MTPLPKGRTGGQGVMLSAADIETLVAIENAGETTGTHNADIVALVAAEVYFDVVGNAPSTANACASVGATHTPAATSATAGTATATAADGQSKTARSGPVVSPLPSLLLKAPVAHPLAPRAAPRALAPKQQPASYESTAFKLRPSLPTSLPGEPERLPPPDTLYSAPPRPVTPLPPQPKPIRAVGKLSAPSPPLVPAMHVELGDDSYAALSRAHEAAGAEPANVPPPSLAHGSTGAHKSGRPSAKGSGRAGVPPEVRPNGGPLRRERAGLPIAAFRSHIMQTLAREQVVVLQGDTGCGKTTQLCQYILEEAAVEQKAVHVVCTQPRRISAIGVAERVAAERGEAVGGTVGYSIRLENNASSATRLLFCTTVRRESSSGSDRKFDSGWGKRRERARTGARR